MNALRLARTSTRVARSTPPDVNDAIRRRANAAIAQYEEADAATITARLAELDREWDIERVLQLNAGSIALLGTLLAHRVDARFLILSAAVFGFFLQHALQGWCPPIPVMRRMGVRTAAEIAREKHALKVMRGDFEALDQRAGANQRVAAVLSAIDA